MRAACPERPALVVSIFVSMFSAALFWIAALSSIIGHRKKKKQTATEDEGANEGFVGGGEEGERFVRGHGMNDWSANMAGRIGPMGLLNASGQAMVYDSILRRKRLRGRPCSVGGIEMPPSWRPVHPSSRNRSACSVPMHSPAVRNHCARSNTLLYPGDDSVVKDVYIDTDSHKCRVEFKDDAASRTDEIRNYNTRVDVLGTAKRAYNNTMQRIRALQEEIQRLERVLENAQESLEEKKRALEAKKAVEQELRQEKDRLRKQLGLNAGGYPFTSHWFHTAGKKGMDGPSLQQVREAYSGTEWAQHEQNLSVDNGMQIWTVPHSSKYHITAYGGGTRGRIRIEGKFNLRRGTKIRMLAGQEGTRASCGSGGTFVVNDSSGDLMLVAGGNGGVRDGKSNPQRVGSTTRSGRSVSGFRWMNPSGGRNGQGGEHGFGCQASGGAGYIGDGKGCPSRVAESFQKGAKGGRDRNGHQGGFGGGGVGWSRIHIGGGGGYSGGAGSMYRGGGGGSYISDSAEDKRTTELLYTTRSGGVRIRRLTGQWNS